jgi:Tol biopolymer transport system component
MRLDRVLIFFIALHAVLLAACQPQPTPTLVPFPTATYIRTETPKPPKPKPTTAPVITPIRAVVTDTLRVRQDPNTSATILGRLKKDTVVMLLARKDDNQWLVIEYPPDSGDHGWIAAGFVIADAPTENLPVALAIAPPPNSIYAIVLHLLNVRRGPSKDYDIIATIPAGARVTIVAHSEDGQWYQIVYPPDSRRRAWVLGDQLQLQGTPDQVPAAPAPPTPTPVPTPLPRPTSPPALSPVGGRILIASNRSGAYDIYSVAENGVTRARLTNSGNAFGARFSPNGTRIAFARIVATSPVWLSHIFVMNADGSAARDISSSADVSDTDPDWSPDGTRIAFVRTPRAGAPEIWVMNADGSAARRAIALSPATGIAATSTSDFSPQPRWSPDGGRIAYAAVPRGRNTGAPLYPNIFVVNANGTGETQLTDNDLINSSPVWSPDGSQIVWSAKDFINRQNWRVWTMSASGGNQRTLIGGLGGDPNNGVQAVEWIGNRILLAGWSGNWDAYFAHADGSGIAQVTQDNADDKPTDWLP